MVENNQIFYMTKIPKLYLDIDGVLIGKDGTTGNVIDYLGRFCDADTLRLAGQVKAAPWTTAKTEAINLKSDFYWVDDSPLQFEIDILKANGRLDRWVPIDTRSRPDDLKRAIEVLQG